MTIYFTASILQKDLYEEHYKKIVAALEAQGHKVLHEHITNVTLGQVYAANTDSERISYYRKVQQWIAKADIVVAEMSFPSTVNIGHEVSMALEKGKAVIGLYVKGKESLFLRGVQADRFLYEQYDVESLPAILKSAIDYAQDQSDTRFNFFISPSLLQYLDWISQSKKIPRSVYLRMLIEHDRENNDEYRHSLEA